MKYINLSGAHSHVLGLYYVTSRVLHPASLAHNTTLDIIPLSALLAFRALETFHKEPWELVVPRAFESVLTLEDP